jgi:transcription elongation factor Elf1
MCVAPAPSVLDTPRPLASLPADLLHTCPVCGHEMAVMVADLPKGRLTQCASCGELDYRRKATVSASVSARPADS